MNIEEVRLANQRLQAYIKGVNDRVDDRELEVSIYGEQCLDIATELQCDEALLLTWANDELARRDAEAADRAKPIDAEWLESIGAYHEWNHGGDAGWYGIELDDDEWLSVSSATGFTHIVMCDGVKQIERRFDTRGQLLYLIAALKGGGA